MQKNKKYHSISFNENKHTPMDMRHTLRWHNYPDEFLGKIWVGKGNYKKYRATFRRLKIPGKELSVEEYDKLVKRYVELQKLLLQKKLSDKLREEMEEIEIKCQFGNYL